MTRNVGTKDRIVRFALAVVAVIVAVLVGPLSLGGIILLVVAGLLVVTGLVGFCPIWRVLGVNTTEAKSDVVR